MEGLKQQVWVTSAVVAEDVEKALTLCYSLRRAYTTRKIAVIASTNLSVNQRNVLNLAFDYVFYMMEDQNLANLKLDDFAKLYSLLALKTFDNCAYVSPSMIAVKNCDDIFSTGTDGIVLVKGDESASIFLFKPSLDHFVSITNGLINAVIKGSSFGHFLENWIINQFQDAKSLDEKYNVELTHENTFLGYDKNIYLVNLMLPRGSSTEALKRTGTLGNLIAIYCEKIRRYDVLPLLNPINDMIDPSPLPPILSYRKEPIAIVGMSCRYPGSNNLEEFWNLLFQGQDGTGSPPAFRWTREQSTKNVAEAMKTNAGFLKVPVDEFDAKFFGISPKEVVFMDPQHRLLHEVVWEALEDACIDPHTLQGTSGSVFMGYWTNDYKDILMRSTNSEFHRVYMGNSIGAATARLSFLLGLTGPSIATESGCSSSMVAVHLACRSLQNGETNFALAGGVNLLLDPFDKDILPLVVSPDGHCKTFSEDANGFSRAEGCGVLVLKRLSDALKHGDKIWALVRGSAVAQEGVSNSMGTPTVHCETRSMEDALKDAQVRPEEVSYVEAHGTGTVVGDPMEVAAIAKAYYSPARKTPLVIGSVKTNVGHTESCSGITGIMKVVLSMLHETIPAHQNFTKMNPFIDLEAIPAVLPLESMEWQKRKGAPRIAGVSSFGITGTDAHVILEESPELPENVLSVHNDSDRPLHLLKISAKTEETLEILLRRYRDKMQSWQESLPDIAYSSNIGRTNFAYRAAIIASTKDDAVSYIDQRKFLNGEVHTDFQGKVCFLFTGLGCQYQGMAKRLYDCSPVFQVHFDYCNGILKKNYNISLEDALWGSNSGSEQDINRTIFGPIFMLSIFCLEYALLKLWESWGVKPDYALGHSLGEYAATVCAGIISVEDALKLLAERCKLIEDLPPGKMLVIMADQCEVDKKMKIFAGGDTTKLLDYAAINSSSQTVIAGDSDTIMEFSKFCIKNKLKCVVLAATHAFHSRHMDPMTEKFREVAKTTKKSPGQLCEYISGMRGELVSMEDVDEEYWVQHTRDTVNFQKASQKAVELGCVIFIEIGPQPVLSALTMMNNDVNLLCLPSMKRGEDDWEVILNAVGKLYVKGIEFDWNGFDQFYNRRKVQLPHYPFIGKKFWPDLMQVSGNVIHPLIGSVFPNASSSKIFQNGVNLSTHSYLKEHAIGQTVVFPGAGYLEMCIAAGLATVEDSTDALGKPTRPMKVENLMIKAPLQLQEERTTQLQTVVELNKSNDNQNDWNDMNVKIFHRQEANISDKWVEHAVATFSPLPTAEEQMISFDVERLQETILQPSKSEDVVQVYDKLASLGLKFGPIFRSLEKIWKSEENSTLLAKVKVPENTEGQSGQYIIHPVVLDAMIQAIMMLKGTSNAKVKLCVPIRIGKLLWLSNSTCESSDIYIHVYENALSVSGSSSSHAALLLDARGKLLALMTGVEFIETTVKAVEAVLEQQTSPMPDLWEETWRPSTGPLQYRYDLAFCRRKIFYDDEYLENHKRKYNKLSPVKHDAFLNLERLVYLNFLRCLYDCGWEPSIDASFTVESLAEKLSIQTKFTKMLSYILQVLEEEGIMQNIGPGPATYKVTAIPPSIIEIHEELSSLTYTSDLVKIFKPTLLFEEVGKHYGAIFKGTQSILPILFPEDPVKSRWPPVADFYTDYAQLFGTIEACLDVAYADMKHFKARTSGQKNVLRILEVGAGTGNFTQSYLQVLKEHDVKVEYTFTDISPAFFPVAEKTLEQHLTSLTFKKLNIEEDPVSQGFIPNYYDCVIASDVIHATRNLSETYANLRSLLRPNGKFVMMEQTKKNRIITYLFGLLDGFWRFDDVDLRPDHCTLSTEKWKETLESAGFNVLENFPFCNNYHAFFYSFKESSLLISSRKLISSDLQKSWILFHQEDSPTSKFLLEQIASTTDRKVITVQRGRRYKSGTLEKEVANFELRPDSEQDFVNLMDAVEDYCGQNLEGIIYAWSLDKTRPSQDSILQPYFYLAKSFLGKKQSSTAKLICLVNGIMPVEDNDLSHFHSSTIWGFIKTLCNERIDLDCLCIDIGGRDEVTGAEQIFYELWNSSKDTQVVYHDKTRYTCKLQALKPNLVDLKLPNGSDRFQLILPETKSFSDLQFGALEPFILKDEEIEVQVIASALNFKDIFNILKPSDDFKNSNAVGFDFAGIVKRVGSMVSQWSVGDQVFGLNVNGDPLPSHIKLHETVVLRMPDGMTFPEACTLPAVVATSYHCLLEVAKITATDTVLIHAASGGVGLSAIQICKNVGATIIATAGSKRKQNCLRSLGIKHIFHSRNTDYGDAILKVTNGRGVDVVLNSLTSEGFKEATLKACAKNARFVEMSKLSIWQPEEVKQLRPDVDYTIIDLSSMAKHQLRPIMKSVYDLAVDKVVTPIPYVRFDAVHIKNALQYLQKAKHIGKVVVVLPEIRLRNGNSNVVHTPMFNANATYLITGGMGGIGFVICQWMVEKGARNIVLAGRSLPSDKIISFIDKMRNERRVNIVPVQLDVSDFEKCKELIEVEMVEMRLPPLKGVMHAAGTLRDGLIENQTWENLSSTFKTKVDGTLNLHELTKNLNLEHFVLFSSMAATFGSPGQCNHTAGNMFEDTFAHYRHSIGLPATTVNWGQWGEVGIATEVDLPGVKTLSNLQGTTGLEFALKSQRSQTGIFNIESFVLLSKLFPQILNILDERVLETSGKGNSSGHIHMISNEFWQQYDNSKSFEERSNIIKEKLKFLLRNILKLDDVDVIDDNGNFQEMGVDSLMFVEMKNFIQALLENRATFNVSAMKDSNTVNRLADTLIKLIEGGSIEEEKSPTAKEVATLIHEDCQLPEHISAKPDQIKVGVKDISKILLTGCSGTLGPYILKELSNTPKVTEIICLMRPTKSASGMERLQKILKDRDLLSHIDMEKVRCVKGNVALPKIGMEPNEWEELCNRIDAVFHVAASVQHMEHYRKRDSDRDMRAVNVQGTKNILEFACTGSKLKHVYCASSMLAVTTVSDDGHLSEDWPGVNDYNGVTTLAYPITKFIGDVLMKQAILERGIPGKVFRFPLIVGDSQTGRFVLDKNHVMLRYMFILQHLIMPSISIPLPMLPVDTCAWASVQIFFNQNAPDDIFNVSNINPAPEQEFVSVAEKLGYKVDIVDFKEFSEKIRNSTPDDSPFAIFKDFYRKDENMLSIFHTSSALKEYVLRGGSDEKFMVSKKIAPLLPEFYNDIGSCMDHIYRDMLFAKSQGWFAKFNLK